MAEEPAKTSNEGSGSPRKPIETKFVNDDIVNRHIEEFTHGEGIIVVKAATPYFKSNYKEIDNSGTTGTGTEGNSGGTTKQETAQIDENISFPLTNVINGMNITAKTQTKEMKKRRDKNTDSQEKGTKEEK